MPSDRRRPRLHLLRAAGGLGGLRAARRRSVDRIDADRFHCGAWAVRSIARPCSARPAHCLSDASPRGARPAGRRRCGHLSMSRSCPGKSASAILQRLQEQGIIRELSCCAPICATWAADRTIQAGHYSLGGGMTPRELAQALQHASCPGHHLHRARRLAHRADRRGIAGGAGSLLAGAVP